MKTLCSVGSFCVIILGGLATSTLLNLFLLPALYTAFGQRFRSHPSSPIVPAAISLAAPEIERLS